MHAKAWGVSEACLRRQQLSCSENVTEHSDLLLLQTHVVNSASACHLWAQHPFLCLVDSDRHPHCRLLTGPCLAVQNIIVKFPDAVLDRWSEVFFLPLVAHLTSDPSIKCR